MKELAENYATIKQAKALLEDKIEKIKEKMKEIEGQIYDRLVENNSDGAILGDLKVQIKKRRVYSAGDWQSIYAHIMATQDFSLLQARLSSTRLKELEADGVEVGSFGVKSSDLQELSVTKVKRG